MIIINNYNHWKTRERERERLNEANKLLSNRLNSLALAKQQYEYWRDQLKRYGYNAYNEYGGHIGHNYDSSYSTYINYEKNYVTPVKNNIENINKNISDIEKKMDYFESQK